MTTRLGVIAEDHSDVEVIHEIALKVAPAAPPVIRRFVSHGCGKLRSKCSHWAHTLSQQRCDALIVIHDLDDSHLPTLLAQLRQALTPCPISRNMILIPIREIEAWLLSDHVAIRSAMKLKKPVPKIANPQSIFRPKERLEEIVYSLSGKTKRYVSTVHNKKVAAELDLKRLRRCDSFIPLEEFLRANIR